MRHLATIGGVICISLLASAGFAAEDSTKLILKKDPKSVSTLDGAITAYCELSGLNGDVYTNMNIVATNNVNHLIKCTFNCAASRKGGGEPYRESCTLSIPGGKTSGCGFGTNLHDYVAIVDGGYSCE